MVAKNAYEIFIERVAADLRPIVDGGKVKLTSSHDVHGYMKVSGKYIHIQLYPGLSRDGKVTAAVFLTNRPNDSHLDQIGWLVDQGEYRRTNAGYRDIVDKIAKSWDKNKDNLSKKKPVIPQ